MGFYLSMSRSVYDGSMETKDTIVWYSLYTFPLPSGRMIILQQLAFTQIIQKISLTEQEGYRGLHSCITTVDIATCPFFCSEETVCIQRCHDHGLPSHTIVVAALRVCNLLHPHLRFHHDLHLDQHDIHESTQSTQYFQCQWQNHGI